MKSLVFSCLLLFPSLVFSQKVDTVAIKRQLDSLYKAAQNLARQGDLDAAYEVNTGAEKLALATLGKQSAAYATICYVYGRIYFSKGNAYPEAAKWLLEGLTIGQKIAGKNNKMYAQVAGALAFTYSYLGQYDKAEYYTLEAMAARESISGNETYDYALLENNLGAIYEVTGQYEKAEAAYLESKAIRGRVLGIDHTEYAASLNNLAVLYQRLGQYEKSETYNLDAIQTWERCCGKNDPDYALGLYNLATLYNEMGKVEKAMQLALEAKSIMEKTIGKEHNDYTRGLAVLALLLKKTGRFSEALDYCLEAKSTQERTIGKETIEYAMNLHILAETYHAMGDYETAEAFFLEIKDLREKKMGKNNAVYTGAIAALSRLYNDMGQVEKAKALLDETITIERDLLAKSLRYLSERELISYSKTFRNDLDFYFSFAQNNYSNDPETAGECYNNALFYKGFVLMASKRVRRLAEANPVSAEQFDFLKFCHRALSAEYAKPDASQTRILELEMKTDSIEKLLAKTVAGFGEALNQVTWQEVQANLKPGEAAIEFVHFQTASKNLNTPTQYAAILLRSRHDAPGSERVSPKFIPLFEETEIARLVAGAVGKADQKINAMYSTDGASGGKSLFDLIWKPLATDLKGVKRVYYTPSGLLHRINLAAILTASNSDPVHRLSGIKVIVLSSTRNLSVSSNFNSSISDAYLIGGVRYAPDAALLPADSAVIGSIRGAENLFFMPFSPDTTTRGDNWKYLPASLTEVLVIGKTLRQASWSVALDTGFVATEENVRNHGLAKPSPRLMHFATHGYFFPDPVGTKNNVEPVFKISDHPMLRSGLILAGSNDAWQGKKTPKDREDGILTAYEISQMNLSNTELVVLSACETGLGDIEGNEGVFGLQRAFKIAGAKYLIMSLWKVSDKSSHEMMTDFYKQWLEVGLAIPNAFNNAQQNMKAKYPDAPYHWAGFVLIE